LASLGHACIADVRQGKYFDITLSNSATDREAVAKEIDEISRDVLSNPVIEEFRVELLD
jgi:phosphoribosylformylglycinamidine synthase PurS subunit